MIIEKIELFKVPPRWLFVKVQTKSGYVGWGEPVLEGRTDSVAAAVEDIAEFVIGKSAEDVEDIFGILTRGGFYRPGPILMSAVSGIEQSLWDIKGKHYNTPVYKLLGGAVREKVRIYGWVGGDMPSDAVEQAVERKNQGFSAIKTNLCSKSEWIMTKQDVKSINKYISDLRNAVGDSMGIAIDFHGRVHKNMLKTLMKELEEFYPMFYEEPLLPEYTFQYKDIAKFTTVPLACGERLIGRREFRPLLETAAVDIIQPDICHTGGIWETRKIAAAAEMYDIAVAPHCPLGPIAFAASMQLNACTPNAVILESSMGIHYNEDIDMLDYLNNKEVFKMNNGFVNVPEGPGLGIEMNEVFIREMARKGHNWRNPLWRGEDGSILEW